MFNAIMCVLLTIAALITGTVTWVFILMTVLIVKFFAVGMLVLCFFYSVIVGEKDDESRRRR